MADAPPADLTLTPLNGQPRTVREWTVTFHLLLVALDPFTHESSWVLPTAQRVMHTFSEADCRVAWLLTATPDECALFLGPLAREYLTFADPDRAAVKALGLGMLPAIVHVGMDGSVAKAEGWEPMEWREVTERLARVLSWVPPALPTPRDPGPFAGTPAAG